MSRAGELFGMAGRVCVITGGAGLLGTQHAQILADAGASVVLLDVACDRVESAAALIQERFGTPCIGLSTDITNLSSVEAALHRILQEMGRIDVLINNAANNPKVEANAGAPWSRMENFPLSVWEEDIRIGLTGSFLCSRVFGAEMARCGSGVILNIASDLGVIAPDQRLYRKDGLPENQQPVKPVTYSVVKSGLIGLTRYLATYWNEAGVRVNALSPGGVAAGQPEEFTTRLHKLIPLGRMAAANEYQGAVLFLCSDASSYMTGANLIVDGGRSCW